MICPSCNMQNRDDAKFCKKCGYPFHTESASVTGEEASRPDISAEQASSVSTTAEEQPVSSASPQAAVSGVGDEGDVSTLPTQILTPQEMMAYHARRWQQEVEQDQQTSQGSTAENSVATSEANLSTPVAMATPAQHEQPQDIADLPTVVMNPSSNEWPHAIPPSPASPILAEDEPVPIPPPPPASSSPVTDTSSPPVEAAEVEQATGRAETTDGQKKEPASASADAIGSPTLKEENAVPQIPTDSPDQNAPTSEFPMLAVGTIVSGRYEITEVVSEEPHEHVYHVNDHQGYQHCWNCGSEQNSEGDEFCINCGAELLECSYIMHEYPATASEEVDASVLQGTILNTFVEQGHTYVIEQAQVEQDAFPNGVHLLAAGDSDAGNVRRSEPNEDSVLVLMLERNHESISTPAGVFIVADGLGGHDNGQVASHMTINIIAERMVRTLLMAPLSAEKTGNTAATPLDETALVTLLQGSVEDANAAICQVNQQDKTDMGSTITGFMVVGDHAYILNVGDSRTYMMRGGQIYQLTNDHSLVGQLVAGGLIQPDDVYTHPQRSQIFRSLGDKLNVQIDIFKQQLHPGDILLSCSDGLWEMVRNPQIESILNNAPDPQTACTQLLEAANTNGGEDNVTAIVVFVH